MKQLFITGASGCIGHYVLEEILEHYDDCQCHLLIRDEKKLHPSFLNQSRFVIHKGSLEDIDLFKDVLQQMDYVMHIATNWRGPGQTTRINIEQTKRLFMLAESDRLQKIIYFSTASILGPGNQPIVEAEKYGSSYVRSKYIAHQMLDDLPMKDKIITVFPTMVFGGNDEYPQSHITSGILPNKKYMKLLRFIYIDGKFHFLHSKDIARVCLYLCFNATEKSEYVLGNEAVSVKEAIADICHFFNIWQPFRIHIPISFIFFLAKLLRIKIGPWEKHCLNNPYMVFDTVSPATFGLKTERATIQSVLESA